MPDVEKVLDRLPKSKRAVHIAAAVLVIVVFALIGILFWQVHQNSQVAAENAAVARSRGQALGTANAKLTQNGIPAVKPTDAKATPGVTDVGPTTPSLTPRAGRGVKGDRGDRGEPGPGPSTAQVQQAVSEYCDAHGDCAHGPTQAQVAAAVLTFCDNRSDCTGPAGQDGADATGKPGASGSPGASGEPGRAPTADEISDAVDAYCGDGACRGAAGDPGPTGPAGPAGRDGSNGTNGKDAARFTKVECTSTNDWLFTLSDGSTLTAAGPCRATTSTVTTTVTAPPSSPEPTSTAP